MKYHPKMEKIKKGCGCQHCHGSGYSGRIGIFSFLEITREVAEVIHGDISLNAISEVAEKQGFKDLDSQAVELAESGITSLNEILPYLSSNQSMSSKGNSKISKKHKVGIISEAVTTKEKILSVLHKQRGILAQVLNTIEEDDVDIVILDDSLPLYKLEQELKVLYSKKSHVPLIYLGENKGTDISQKTNIIYMKRNSSPIAVAHACMKALKG
jgi:hypothetical protein